MPNLWTLNTPQRFWQSGAYLTDAQWEEAMRHAVPRLGLDEAPEDVEELLALTLGEGRLGDERWQLSPSKHVYYLVKPLLPRALTRVMRRMYGALEDRRAGSSGAPAARTGAPEAASPRTFESSKSRWPADTRYADFLWELMRGLVEMSGKDELPFTHFWPNGRRYALVLTHDVETAEGQAFVRQLADVDESFGFRSSFNFVPERYGLDHELLEELRARGFEVGVHGLKHDGKLFRSRATFERRVERINHYLRELDAVGFRSPLTHRHAEWMQALDIEYDLSFFDTDPHEPMPGGTLSLWPFHTGRFVELPYTLVQDYVLTAVLQETTPRIWLDKVDLIRRYHGMALVNSHPDYMRQGRGLDIYCEFLQAMRDSADFWHALPRDVARWWRLRLTQGQAGDNPDAGAGLPDALPVEAAFRADGTIVLPGERIGAAIPEIRESAGRALPGEDLARDGRLDAGALTSVERRMEDLV